MRFIERSEAGRLVRGAYEEGLEKGLSLRKDEFKEGLFLGMMIGSPTLLAIGALCVIFLT